MVDENKYVYDLNLICLSNNLPSHVCLITYHLTIYHLIKNRSPKLVCGGSSFEMAIASKMKLFAQEVLWMEDEMIDGRFN